MMFWKKRAPEIAIFPPNEFGVWHRKTGWKPVRQSINPL